MIAAGTAVRAATGGLGTATPPFVANFGPRAAGPLEVLLAIGALALLVATAPRLLNRPRRPAGFVAAVFVLALAAGLAVNAARRGPEGWWMVFELGPGGSFEAKNEYLPGLPALSYGSGYFLDRFAELVPSLPVNVAGHPPGLMLVLHWTGVDGARGMAALCIACFAAVAPATYALARQLGEDERVARAAALLACASPGLLLFGVTSADAVYALLGTLAAALLAGRGRASRAAGCGALALAAFFSWALLAVGAWATLLRWRRAGVRAALLLAAGCALAFAAFVGALWAAAGYDALGTLRATEAYYRNSVASARPYAFWVLGSPAAFLVSAGLPIAAGWLAGAARGRASAVALAGVVATAAVLGFTKAEVERIWLFLVPLACVAAAPALFAEAPRGGPLRAGSLRAGSLRAGPLRAALTVLAAQAVTTQLLFDTIW